MPDPNSARLVDGHLAPDEAWVTSAAAAGGMSLAALVAGRGSLEAGEVVTLVAPLAETLARLHARGLELTEVRAETVWVAADGRPVLLPVGPRGVGGGGADVRALATLALEILDRSSRAGRLTAALEAAAGGRLDAASLAVAVLRAEQAMPITTAAPTAPSPRSPIARVAAVVGAVVLAGIVLGGLWGRHDGAAVLAAPPSLPTLPTSAAPTAGAAPTVTPSWRAVVATLERTRAAAFATGNPPSLSAVYADGSPTGSADRRLLERLAQHGQRAAGLRAYVERVVVVTRAEARVTLSVTDALTAYDVVARDGHVVRRGSGRPSRTWRMSLQRTANGWRIWSVRLSA